MPIHPAPPTDLPGLVTAFTQTVQSVADLGRRLTPEQLALPTDCPGWSVKDQIAHVVAVEAHLEGLEPPTPAFEMPDYVRNDLGRFMEGGVQARRSRSGQDLVNELEHVMGRRVDTLGSPGLTLDSIVPGLDIDGSGRGVPARELLEMRILDVWVHEQDIRSALDEPGSLDTPAASVYVAAALRSVPAKIARRADVPLGDTVILELTGPVTTRIGVRVDEGTEEDPRPVGTVLFGGGVDPKASGTTTTTLRAIDPHTQITTVKLSTHAFERLASGRRGPDGVTSTVAGGDAEVARRVLAGLAFVP